MRVDGVFAVLAVFAACAPRGVYGADTAWVEESISTHETGSWSQTVLYNRSTGLATFNGGEHTYVPNSPSAGDYVTLNLRMAFSEPDCGTFPYSVSVQDDKGTLRLLRSASGAHAFPLAVKADAIKTITFEGKAKFRSLKGSCTSFKATRRDWSQLGAKLGPRAEIGPDLADFGRRHLYCAGLG